jgi:sec-independent protein translocase protein TatB
MNGTILNLGPLEIIVILVLMLLVLGPERLPELTRGFGRALRRIRELYVAFVSEYRRELQPIAEEIDNVTREIQGELVAIREATDLRNVLQPVAEDIKNATADVNTDVNKLNAGMLDKPAAHSIAPPSKPELGSEPVDPPAQAAEPAPAAEPEPARPVFAPAQEISTGWNVPPGQFAPKAPAPAAGVDLASAPAPDLTELEKLLAQDDTSLEKARTISTPDWLTPKKPALTADMPQPVLDMSGSASTPTPVITAPRVHIAPGIEVDASNPWGLPDLPEIRSDKLDDDNPWRF